MEIYKAPKYLILQIKRFENTHDFMQAKKLNTQVNFPIEGLDLTNHVLNHELPGKCMKDSDLNVTKVGEEPNEKS